MTELDRSLCAVFKNDDEESTITFSKAISAVKGKLSSLSNSIQSDWNEENYPRIATVMKKLEQKLESGEHNQALVESVKQHHDKLLSELKDKIVVISTHASLRLKADQLNEVEPFLVKLKNIEYRLRPISGLRQTSQHRKIVEELKAMHPSKFIASR